MMKKKIWANFQRIIELFNLKKNIGLGSGIWKKHNPDPGTKKGPNPRSRIRNTAISALDQKIMINFLGLCDRQLGLINVRIGLF